MSGRGADKAPRAKRGAPTAQTLEKRSRKKVDESQRADRHGFSRLFSTTPGAAASTGDEAEGAQAGTVHEESEHGRQTPGGGAPSGAHGSRADPEPRDAAARPPARTTCTSPGIGLDSESEDEDTDPEDDEPEQPIAGHVRRIYAAVYARLQVELDKKGPPTDNWLVRHLRANGWWLRAGCAALVDGTLVLEKGVRSAHFRVSVEPDAQAEVFYERDLLVCLPDEMWGMSLTCPSCGEADKVKVHGYSEQPARRIHDPFQDFDVMGRRHCCTRCYQVQGGRGEGEGGGAFVTARQQRALVRYAGSPQPTHP